MKDSEIEQSFKNKSYFIKSIELFWHSYNLTPLLRTIFAEQKLGQKTLEIQIPI